MIFSPKAITKAEFDEVANGAQVHSNVLLDYRKKYPVAIIELPFGVQGNTTVPVVSVDFFGNGETAEVGSVICFDMENPWHIKQLGAKASVILNPSYDW